MLVTMLSHHVTTVS